MLLLIILHVIVIVVIIVILVLFLLLILSLLILVVVVVRSSSFSIIVALDDCNGGWVKDLKAVARAEGFKLIRQLLDVEAQHFQLRLLLVRERSLAEREGHGVADGSTDTIDVLHVGGSDCRSQ